MSRRPALRQLALVAPGLLVALPALPWVWDACARSSWATLGRDQGIFQYIAWAVRGGATAYRDVRDVNGPLVVMVHDVMHMLGGEDEHRFRVLDLVLVALTAMFAGACLPWLTHARGAVRSATMALAAWAVVSAQYVAYGFWDTAQRESFFDAFVLVSMGLQWLAQARSSRRLLFAAGAFAAMPWLGKPTFVLMTLGQFFALLVDEGPRVRRFLTFAAGCAAGALVPFSYLVLRGDVRAWASITFVDVPAMYRFIWPRLPMGLLREHQEAVWLAVAPSIVILALVLRRRMPRAALTLATFPLAGLASALLQSKGFLYHFHPVTLGGTLALLAIVDFAWTELEHVASRVVAAVLALAFGFHARQTAMQPPYPFKPAVPGETEANLAPYIRVDFFPWALRRAAAHVDRHTPQGSAIQVYGMDPYFLFLAKRRSASPYIYSYDLNVDVALHGSFDEGGPRPDEAQRARISTMRADHERDMLARFEREAPAAFVFIGRSPLMTHKDALRDFEEHCPEAAAWFGTRYRETGDFDGIRVFLREDLAARVE